MIDGNAICKDRNCGHPFREHFKKLTYGSIKTGKGDKIVGGICQMAGCNCEGFKEEVLEKKEN